MPSDPIVNSELGYQFSGKPRLPRGQSYPLKRSQLDDFLRREQITTITGVSFLGSSKYNSRVLSADYYGSGRAWQRRAFNVAIYSVRSEWRSAIAELILSTALPALADWIRSFSDPSLLRSQTDHSICFVVEAAPISSSSEKDPGLRLRQQDDYRKDRKPS